METLSYDPYDRRGSWIVSRTEFNFPDRYDCSDLENVYGNTHRRRSAIIADELLLKYDHVDLINQLDYSGCCCNDFTGLKRIMV